MSLTYRDSLLYEFLTENNAIEGIFRAPTDAEMNVTRRFLAFSQIRVLDLINLVEIYAPGHVIRAKRGLNVRVGDYVAPPGGPEIVDSLRELLRSANDPSITTSPWSTHLEYENLHPFTDGNGRSGRTLWVWQMLRQNKDPFAIRFLHRFYYQTLSESRQG